jgi:hypothetical protein
MRWTYHLGILSLLVGVSALLVPPHHISTGRWAVIAIGVAGLATECAWISYAMLRARTAR